LPRAVAVERPADDADVELVEEEAGPATAIDLARALPPETAALWVVEDPFAVAEALGRAQLIARFPEEHAQMVREMRDGAGVDLTDPAGFEAFGLAPHAPAGLAVLRQANGVIPAVLLTVKDRATLRARLLGLERDWLPVERIGGAELFGSDRDRSAFIIARGVALFVDEIRPPVRDFARELVERSALDRLDRTEAFRAAMDGLPATADARAFVSPTALLPAELRAVSFAQDLQGIGLATTLHPGGARGELRVALRVGSALDRVARSLRAPVTAALPAERFGAELDLGGLLTAIDAWNGVGGSTAPAIPPVTAREAAPVRAKRRQIAELLVELGRQRELLAQRARLRASAGRHLGTLRLTLAPTEGGLGGSITLTPGAATFGDAWVAFADALEDAEHAGQDSVYRIHDLRSRLDSAATELRVLQGASP